MSETQAKQRDLGELRELLTEFGVPFAKALAVFVRESSKSLHRLDQGGDRPQQYETENVTPLDNGVALGSLQALEELDPTLRDELNAVIDAYESSVRTGEQDTMEFTADSPVVAAAHRLRRVAGERDISQKELARRLNVTPSVISRVFKNPDRSRLATLRKIAHALGVELHEIV